MDNARDADRIEGGGRLFSVSPAKRHITKLSGSHCDGGKVTGLNKPKKHKFRKLHAVGESLSCRERRMGFVGSDSEDGIRPGNGSCGRFKSPKMIVDDCNTVYHASVPRKLRSAIRKRNNEPNSPPLRVSKKLKHVADGVKLPRKDGVVKPNLNKKQDEAEVCITDATLGLITKDEEEVAEALFALAVVFPDATHTDKKKLADKQSGASSSSLTKAEDSTSRIKETVHDRDDMRKCFPNELDPTPEVILPSPSDTEKPDVSAAERESGYHIPEVNLCLTEFVSENECTIQRPREFVVSSACTDLGLEHGSKLLKPEKNLAACNHAEISLEQNEAAPSLPEVKGVTKARKDTGSSLCPALPSRMSNNQEGSCSVKHPAWFESSSSIVQSPISDGTVAKKDAHVFTDSRKSWKRCSTHVYISRFIKAFQITDGRDRSLVKYAQLTTNESQKQGSDDISNSPAWMRNGLNGSVYNKSSSFCLPEKDSTEVRNAILLHERLVQDQQQCSTTSGICHALKQSIGVLSLPSGSGVETINSNYKPGQGPEALSPFPLPCLQSQNQSAVPFPVSQAYYSSAYFSGHPSATAVQQFHLPAFAGSMSPRAGSSTSTPSQPEQRQTKKWASVLMAHHKSGVASSSVPNWQSGPSDLPPMFHQPQILFSPSRSSAEAMGSKYTPTVQHQQRASASTALPPSTIRGQYHHLPSIYEGNVGGARPAYSDNLQSAYLRC